MEYYFSTKQDPQVYLRMSVYREGLFKKSFWLSVVAPWLIEDNKDLPIEVGSLKEAEQIAIEVRRGNISLNDLVVVKAK